MNDQIFMLTKTGDDFFKKININCQELQKMNRQFAKPCLDWTEREYHLSGSLGSSLLEYLLSNRLLIQSKNKSRVVILTDKGKRWIKENLSID